MKKTNTKKSLQITGIFVLAAVLLMGFSNPTTTYAIIGSVVPDAVLLFPAPLDVSEEGTESNTQIITFNEKQRVLLISDLGVDHDGTPGEYDATNVTNGIIPAGTWVDSHYVHFDAELDDGTVFELTGTVNFTAPIIGIAVTDLNKTGTDTILGNGTTDYSGPRALETSAKYTDDIIISSDSMNMTAHWFTSTGVDAVRVITEPVRLNTTAWGDGSIEFTPVKKSWATYEALAGDCNTADQIIDLYAKQTILVGNATLTCGVGDGNDVSVLITLDYGVELVGSHIHTEEDDKDFPMTKKGNPKVGKFEENGGTDNPILVDGDIGYIAIHLGVEIFEDLLP